MSDLPSRCAQVNLSVSLPQFNCTNNTLGDFGNLSDFGRAIGSVPGQLGNIAYCVGDSVRAQIEAAIQSLNDTLTRIFAAINITIPTPLWPNLQAPELEFELRASALFQEFKLYLQQKLFDIIKNIPGLGFIVNLVNVPIPFLSGVRVFDVFSAEGRARIRAAVAARLDQIASAMGMPWDSTFSGNLGLKLPELQLEYIIRRIFSEVERLLSSALWSALSVIHTLTRPIQRIWSQLGFPTLPSFQFPSFDQFFTNIWNSIKDLAISMTEKLQRAMTAMLNFDLGAYLSSAFGSILGRIPWPFPTRLADLLGWLNRDWNISMPEWDFSRLTGAIQTLFNRIPQIILELWLQLIKPFLDAIKGLLAGVAELLKYIPFTFCSFINLVASPLLSLGSTISGLLPASIPVVAAPTVTPPPP
jgi:hypothetical protein